MEENKMENLEFEKVEIGEDIPQVEAKQVIIVGFRLDTLKKEEKEIGKKVVFVVDHPDIKDRELEISSAKYEINNKIKVSGIWWKTDKDNKIPYKSALGNVLRHYNAKVITDMKGKQVETSANEEGYLAIKAY